NYEDYLLSLEMKGEIAAFKEPHIARISQLTNKSNQFNLTTLRCTEEDIVKMAGSPEYVTLYGRLIDRFGDNGLVSVEAAKIGCVGELLKDELGVEIFDASEDTPGTAAGQAAGAGCASGLSGEPGAAKDSADASAGNSESASALIILNLMSCRVLKRDMEVAMLDELAVACAAKGVKRLYGVYLPTKKNAMVKELYGELGFTLTAESEGVSLWRLELEGYEKRCKVIDLKEKL
ncbi:MAG: hypothetical protein HUJ75_05545, partial [Parasporobacterium sp.]|nr:hypothetical protein [Parasporobacterium sp.]